MTPHTLSENVLIMANDLLETTRLILRPVCATDVNFLCRLYGDPLVMRHYDAGTPYDPGHVQAMTEYDIERRKYTRLGSWVIVERASGEPIGHGGFERHTSLRAYTLYYLLRRQSWGKGYATEFARRAVEHGFAEQGFQQIHATTYPQNAASIHVLEKAGMRFVRYVEELDRNLYVIEKLWHDAVRSGHGSDKK